MPAIGRERRRGLDMKKTAEKPKTSLKLAKKTLKHLGLKSGLHAGFYVTQACSDVSLKRKIRPIA
jgi:hypothetical protein